MKTKKFFFAAILGDTTTKHVQKEGMALYEGDEFFTFRPDYPTAGIMKPFRSQGTAQLLSDGTFEFVRKPRPRTQSELIRKLRHGRVSKTKDGAIQLTLKISLEEGPNIPIAILTEALEGERAVYEYLFLKVKG